MNKSTLRTEYEARFGVVVGYFKLYDAKGNAIYSEDSDDWWVKYEYDADGNHLYCETSYGWRMQREYDAKGNRIYSEDVNGVLFDERACNGKVFIEEQTGKKFKMMEIK